VPPILNAFDWLVHNLYCLGVFDYENYCLPRSSPDTVTPGCPQIILVLRTRWEPDGE
jgi:hypothetical protein